MKYVPIRRPRASDYFDEGPILEGRTVYIEDEPVDTGLVDQHGTPLYRVAERIAPGFKVRS